MKCRARYNSGCLSPLQPREQRPEQLPNLSCPSPQWLSDLRQPSKQRPEQPLEMSCPTQQWQAERAQLWPQFARSGWAQQVCVRGHDRVRARLWRLFARSVLDQPAMVLACTTGEGASLASDRRVGLGSASHCVGGHDRLVRCSGLC
jgi:hypothetical protein